MIWVRPSGGAPWGRNRMELSAGERVSEFTAEISVDYRIAHTRTIAVTADSPAKSIVDDERWRHSTVDFDHPDAAWARPNP